MRRTSWFVQISTAATSSTEVLGRNSLAGHSKATVLRASAARAARWEIPRRPHRHFHLDHPGEQFPTPPTTLPPAVPARGPSVMLSAGSVCLVTKSHPQPRPVIGRVEARAVPCVDTVDQYTLHSRTQHTQNSDTSVFYLTLCV